MCGVFGISFSSYELSASRRAVLATNLARLNDLRGGDSWGVVGIRGNEAKTVRGLGDLINNAHELCDYHMLFAHTRNATHGEVNVQNAHPFKIGKILGAHNGIIYNHEELNKKYDRPFEVDSMHLFAHLNEGKSFRDIEGYGAIEWIEKDNPRRIYLSKLLNGELAVYGIGTLNNIKGVVWSSSYKHLLRSLYSAGIRQFFRYDIRVGTVYYAERGKLYINRNLRLNLSPPKIVPIDEESAAAAASVVLAEQEIRMSNPRGTWRIDEINNHQHRQLLRSINQ